MYTATYNVSAAAGVSAPDVAVTVSGAKSGHGNVQAPFTQDQAFAVDTVTPTVTAVTPSAAVVNAALTGGGTFTISVTYSGPMNPSVNPTVAFSRTVSSVLTFASGGWDATGTVYTASYNVAAATASMSGIGVTVSGARNVDGNAQASFTQNSVFDIDTVAPAVVSVTPSVATVTDAQVGAGGFSLSVKFSAAMNTAVNPTINLSPDLGTTLTFVSGSWDATGTVYTATYDVADAGVTVSAVEVTVSDGQSADGNLQTPFDQAGVFGISTV